MISPSPQNEAEGGRPSEDLAEAGAYATAAEGFERGLVVLSMGLPFWLIPSGEAHRLLVEARVVEEVREQIACFERESVGWPPRTATEPLPEQKRTPLSPLFWALLVLAAFAAQNARPGHWEQIGELDSQAVFVRGQWWRPATALFLHADVGHLLSNVVCGIFVFYAVLRVLGVGRGWLLLALASFGGNLAAAGLNYPGPYRSLGASTAIFAGLGLLTGRAIRIALRGGNPARWRSVLVPLAAGIALLGLYGTGGFQTDLTAHAMGFTVGIVVGGLSTARPPSEI